ncbi:MAG: hypothetical protein NZ580_04015 [Bacteroidia bacterium]|nr:hypothetical protein [Bacteroidia bacterium]MDW8236061.1 hypothetical protein [Bacteroidia bacterium]
MLVKHLEKTKKVSFPEGRRLVLTQVQRIQLGYLHAHAEAEREKGSIKKIAVSFGPLHGPFPPIQLSEAAHTARLNGYDMLLCAGFAFDPETQAFLSKVPVQGLEIHLVHIAPDILVGDLLKTTRASQLFSVFGQPDVKVQWHEGDTFTVELRGVDIYNPFSGETERAHGRDVAAWFLDTDYDGQTFHVTQAFSRGLRRLGRSSSAPSELK